VQVSGLVRTPRTDARSLLSGRPPVRVLPGGTAKALVESFVACPWRCTGALASGIQAALSAGAVGELETFEARFEALMCYWGRAIAAAAPRFP
jgi:hypothetical protein